jgi:hypothetical protein
VSTGVTAAASPSGTASSHVGLYDRAAERRH